MGCRLESPLERRERDELEKPVRNRYEQLRRYGETVLAEDVEQFEDLLLHVNDNWDDYSMDAYHGTQGAAVEDIIDTGYLMPSEMTDASTGEIPDKSHVSLSRSRAVAIFYANHGPPTPDQTQEFVGEHLSHITDADYVPDLSTEDGKARFNRLVDHYLETEEELDDVEKHLYNLSDRIDDIGELGGPVVVGLDDEDILNPREEIRGFENELRNEQEGNHLAEVRCDNASLDGGIIYVEDDIRESYQEMADRRDLDIKFRSLEGLKLRHELEMQQSYAEQGVADISSVWDTSDETRPGLGWDRRDYDSRPHRMDLSGTMKMTR